MLKKVGSLRLLIALAAISSWACTSTEQSENAAPILSPGGAMLKTKLTINFFTFGTRKPSS